MTLNGTDIVVCHEPGEGAARSWVAGLGEAWRGLGRTPRVRSVDPSTLGGAPLRPAPAAVVLIGAAARRPVPAALQRAMARLDERGCAVVLVEPASGAEGESAAMPGVRGLVRLAGETTPEAAAVALDAVTQRDRRVAALQAELRRTERACEGAEDEMSRWREEMQLAASMQRELLPGALPRGEGLESGVLFRPAGGVSGDFYDARWLDERRISFFVADAMGHGVPAALLTILVAQSLAQCRNEAASGCGGRPDEVLASLNRALLLSDAPIQRFVTSVYGVLDTRTGEGVVACAGHPAPLVASSDGVRAIDVSGPLLGVFEDAAYECLEFELGAGETLVIYSDGFERALPREGDAAEDAGVDPAAHADRLGAVLGEGACEGAPLAERISALSALLDRQRGSLHQSDDLTALAIRRTAAVAAGAGSESRPLAA